MQAAARIDIQPREGCFWEGPHSDPSTRHDSRKVGHGQGLASLPLLMAGESDEEGGARRGSLPNVPDWRPEAKRGR